jgi:Holliday junction resolvase RusA-like endonuclease
MEWLTVVPFKPRTWGVWTRQGKEPEWHKKLVGWQEDIRTYVIEQHGKPMSEGHVGFHGLFYLPQLKKSKFSGLPLGDTTNFVKAAEDALQGVLYLDDRQVMCHGENEKFVATAALAEGLDVDLEVGWSIIRVWER